MMRNTGRHRLYDCLAGTFLIAMLLAGLGQAATPTAPPVKIKALTRDITVQPDGSATFTSHSELEVLSETLIASLAQQSLQYVESTQTLDIDNAYTLKPDGRKLPVAPGAIITQQAPRDGTSPLYTDIKVKIIIFPNVEVGDTLVYTAITKAKPVLPGQFTYDTVIPQTLYIEATSATVTAPQTMPLNVEAQQLTVETTKGAGNTVYTVHYSNAQPLSDDNAPISRFDRAPRFSLSSFKTYDELARAYAAIAESKLAVTQAIKDKADEITAGAKSRRERAEKIYEWVSTHIRYVALEFGLGSIVPHDAESVLTNGYGDCKDHAVLFAALLQAKNIQSSLVLINASNGYSVAKVPTLGAFNHMITWLPEFKLYADTTARTMPFGFLPRSEYGKPALHIADTQKSLHNVPVLTAEQSTVRYTATDKLDDTARITGTNTTTGTGVFAGVLRGLGPLMQGDETSKWVAGLLKAHGMPRATGSLTAPPTTPLSASYAISGNYATAGGWRAIMEEQAFVPPDALRIVNITGTLLLDSVADDKFKSAAAVPCYSAHVVEDYALEFPAALLLTNLPTDSKTKSAHFDYFSHWSASKNAVTVHREFTASFNEALCTTQTINEAQTSLADIRRDAGAKITFTRKHQTDPR